MPKLHKGESITIREQCEGDSPAVRAINNAAFAGTAERASAEADLVERLRAEGAALLSLVAVAENGTPVGHILFSKLSLTLSDGSALRAAALAPMAVLPEFQRRGIGSALVREGLAGCRSLGIQVIAVVGHRNYYPRFGFSRQLGALIASPYAGDAFMALELEPGALRGLPAVAVYAGAFAELP